MIWLAAETTLSKRWRGTPHRQSSPETDQSDIPWFGIDK